MKVKRQQGMWTETDHTHCLCNDSGPELMLVVRPRGKRGWQTVRQGPLLGLQGNLVWMTVRTLLIHPVAVVIDQGIITEKKGMLA